jgi:hypothetical protein
MGDMDSRTLRAIEQSAAAEAASLLARLRSTAAANQLSVGHGGEPVQALIACVLHDPNAKSSQQSNAAPVLRDGARAMAPAECKAAPR